MIQRFAMWLLARTLKSQSIQIGVGKRDPWAEPDSFVRTLVESYDSPHHMAVILHIDERTTPTLRAMADAMDEQNERFAQRHLKGPG